LAVCHKFCIDRIKGMLIHVMDFQIVISTATEIHMPLTVHVSSSRVFVLGVEHANRGQLGDSHSWMCSQPRKSKPNRLAHELRVINGESQTVMVLRRVGCAFEFTLQRQHLPISSSASDDEYHHSVLSVSTTHDDFNLLEIIDGYIGRHENMSG